MSFTHRSEFVLYHVWFVINPNDATIKKHKRLKIDFVLGSGKVMAILILI